MARGERNLIGSRSLNTYIETKRPRERGPSTTSRLATRPSYGLDVAAGLGTSAYQLLDDLKAGVGEELTEDSVATSASCSVCQGDFIWEIEPRGEAIHVYPISGHPA